jgi:RNA polymerase sigma factor (sigma-70 family)
MTARRTTVFVIDDDRSFLTSITRLLRGAGFTVQPYSSAVTFLKERDAEAPGCVVTDLEMPEINGLELQETLANSGRPLPVLFLTGHGDIPASVAAMRRGAEDFLTKRTPKEALLAAVKRALERNEREDRQRARQHELESRLERLTPRDQEVLTHVLRGRLNKQIAADLGIDERSVKRHRTSVMTKLQVTSVAGLLHLIHEARAVGAHRSKTLLD